MVSMTDYIASSYLLLLLFLIPALPLVFLAAVRIVDVSIDGTNLVAFFAIWVGLGAFASAALQYRSTSRWKQLEFVNSTMRDILQDQDVLRAIEMFDHSFTVVKVKEGSKDDPTRILVDRQHFLDFFAALPSTIKAYRQQKRLPWIEPNQDDLQRFLERRQQIRRVVDVFFERIRYINHSLDSGLIRIDQIKPFLTYWLKLMGGGYEGNDDKHPVWWRTQHERLYWGTYLLAHSFQRREIEAFWRRLDLQAVITTTWKDVQELQENGEQGIRYICTHQGCTSNVLYPAQTENEFYRGQRRDSERNMMMTQVSGRRRTMTEVSVGHFHVND